MRDFGNEPHGLHNIPTKEFDNDDSDFGDLTAHSVTARYFVGDGRYLTSIADTAVLTSLSNASGSVLHDYALGSEFYHVTPIDNFTANVVNVPSETLGRRLTVVIYINQGLTPYAPTTFQINGVTQTPKWVGGTPPTPTASSLDVYTYTLLRLSVGSWIVCAEKSQCA
jgi:hypothetical protein